MKTLIALLVATIPLAAGCSSEPEEPRERFEKPYEDRVKAIEQQNLQRVEDQKKAIDEQSRGKESQDEKDG